MTKDSEHLQWIHDRLKNVHGENENYDYMIRLREIIKRLVELESWAKTRENWQVDTKSEASRLDAESLRQRVPPVKP